jgi:anion-transporting  ArsA/GET3 family ATPase
MTDKLFSVAGVSTLNGETKARFANDVMRVKVLRKNGHTDIVLVELPSEMTKLAAAEFIRELPEFESPVAQAAIDEAIGKRESKPKVERKAQAKKPVVKKPAKPKNMKERAQQLLGLTDEEMAKTPKSILDELENAPF